MQCVTAWSGRFLSQRWRQHILILVPYSLVGTVLVPLCENLITGSGIFDCFEIFVIVFSPPSLAAEPQCIGEFPSRRILSSET